RQEAEARKPNGDCASIELRHDGVSLGFSLIFAMSRQRCREHRRIIRSDLDDQLLENGFGKAFITIRRNHDGARPADDILKIVGVEIRLDRKNWEPVDGDAVAHRFVACYARRPADIIGTVAGYVDRAARGGEWALRQDQPGIVDSTADRGAAAE